VQYAVDKSKVRAVLGGQYDGGDIATTCAAARRPTADSVSATPFGTDAGVAYPTRRAPS